MADLVKYLVTVDPQYGMIVRAERLGADGDISEVPADAFTLDASRLPEPVAKDDDSAAEAGSSDDPKAIGPKGPAPVGPKAVGPMSPPPVGPRAIGPKAVGPKAIGPKGTHPPETEEEPEAIERKSPDDDGEG